MSLRKRNSMTQLDLSKKINYSDKAISRWENGEVVPDVETLQQLSKIFGVSLTYMFEEHYDKNNDSVNNNYRNELILHLLSCCALWIAVAIVFVYVQVIYDYSFWQVFCWGVTLTVLLSIIFVKKWHNKSAKLILSSLFNWTLLASIYLQLLKYNVWLIFIIGIPIQAYIAIAYFAPVNFKIFNFIRKKERRLK